MQSNCLYTMIDAAKVFILDMNANDGTIGLNNLLK